MYELTVVSFFSGAHRLRGYEGKCESLHGHNWKVQVAVEKKSLNQQGLVLDFKVLKASLDSILEVLDHKEINEIDFFKDSNPSSENIARYVYRNMASILKEHACKPKRVTVWEQRDYSATYYED
jgi:6-pyruvoyltetrahydropterin/6-carboxytetrahydropterin synthase